jgi:hypothetical protein
MNQRQINATNRLLQSCEMILDSMSRTEQPAMYARLRSDVLAVKAQMEPSEQMEVLA